MKNLPPDMQLFPQSVTSRILIIGFLFIAAFGVRLYHINKPPLDFAPTRQYQHAHTARGYYYETLDSIPEPLREMSRINKERMGFSVEPRIIEYITVLGYRISGGEHLWIPRVLSTIFWMIGGVFLYLIARKITSFESAFFCMAFYLFLPFSILASRSILADPLMVMMLLCSLYYVLRYHDRPSMVRVLIAAAVSSFAIFIKPICIFLIYGAFLSLSVYREGIRGTIINKKLFLFIIVSMLPAISYYVTGMVMNVGSLRGQASGSFLPHLLLRPYFWRDWLDMIGRVVGFVALIGGIAGLFLMRSALSRVFLTGLWIGYVVFGLTFTFHIHTHEYYHLQFIPVIALSIAPVGTLAVGRMLHFLSSKKRVVVLTIVLGACLFAGFFGLRGLNLESHKKELKFLGSVAGINPQFLKFIREDFARELKMAEEIGDIVDHSTSTVFLTSDFGRSLTYHGILSGLPWPISLSLRERKETGIAIPDEDELFNLNYLTIRTHGKYVQCTPDFFIVTDFGEFEQQQSLKKFLSTNFPILARNEDYVIFDLGAMSGGRSNAQLPMCRNIN